MTVCTLRSTPRTVHIVRRQLGVTPDGIETWCGRRGIPYEPSLSSWRTCRVCEREAAVETKVMGLLTGGQEPHDGDWDRSGGRLELSKGQIRTLLNARKKGAMPSSAKEVG